MAGDECLALSPGQTQSQLMTQCTCCPRGLEEETVVGRLRW